MRQVGLPRVGAVAPSDSSVLNSYPERPKFSPPSGEVLPCPTLLWLLLLLPDGVAPTEAGTAAGRLAPEGSSAAKGGTCCTCSAQRPAGVADPEPGLVAAMGLDGDAPDALSEVPPGLLMRTRLSGLRPAEGASALSEGFGVEKKDRRDLGDIRKIVGGYES